MKNLSQAEQQKLDALRHSAAHLLAAAVLEIWPKAQPTIGPAIENGFYYDFDQLELSENDLPRIEQKMRELMKKWHNFERSEKSPEQALKQMEKNPYKVELIQELIEKKEVITFYKSGEFEDLCRGGHCENPAQELKFFKLLSNAGAYWRGDEKNKMLTRVYGTAFFSQGELDEYLKMMEEAKLRDHRKIGKELGLFTFSDLVGKGLPLWTVKGAAIRRELERFIVDEEIKRGYTHVYTPDIAKVDLYRTSGHYPYYKDSMYAPIKIDDEEFMLRPMTCPHHFELFKAEPRTYKELPLRFAELAKLYRYEQSGELTGLIRVRSFCLADAHIFAAKSMAADEVNRALDLIEYAADIFGFKPNVDYRYRLSLGNRADDQKYFKDDAAWDEAENVLRDVLKNRDIESFEAENEAAFYGPKIDIQMRNVNGKEDTAFTVQYDFVMPKRFQVSYINEHGEHIEPIVIHRSSVGAIERVIAFMIEKYAGNFPLWLSPVQVKVIPISEKHVEYAQKIQKQLFDQGIRVEIDARDDRMQKKIREAQLAKVFYMVVVGDKELEEESVNVRRRDGAQLGTLSLNQFISQLKEEIKGKKFD